MDLLPILSDKKGPMLIAGPCSAETEQQLRQTCLTLAASGRVDILRAGIWKPRTRPNNFEGVGSIGLQWLKSIKLETGLPVAVEVANAKHVYEALRHGVDILWIGARTTANPFSVQEIADALRGVQIPVMVKNPVNPDIGLWLGALERLHKAGIHQLAALHRGFSKYGPSTYRNIPQWQLPIELKRLVPTIQMICDPSHIAGQQHLVPEVAQYAYDLHFDGLMIETHHCPERAWSDASQQLSIPQLMQLLDQLQIRLQNTSDAQEGKVLEVLRKDMDEVDASLMELLAARMQIAQKIGAFKQHQNMAILQQSRWKEVFEKRLSKAKCLGLSEHFMKRYLEAIHQESIQQQRNCVKV